MSKRILVIAAFVIVHLLVSGCSGGGAGNPVTPPDNLGLTETGQSDLTEAPELSGHCQAVWGIWQGMVNIETGEFEIVKMREAAFHLNVVRYLQPPLPPGLSISINDFDPVAGTIDLDLKVKHPFPGTNLRGFDVRGILMGSGDTLSSTLDPAVIYHAPTGFRVLNADGYTRWWNAQEFTTSGMYGFTPGNLGQGFFKPETTLNPYKYYCDALTPDEEVIPDVNASNRGTFSTDLTPPELSRNYLIQFPIGGGGNPVYLFQYAIDASWAPPTGGNPTPKPIGDFPLEANCPEAFHIEVDTEDSTAYYESDTSLGGDLVLNIEVFDWGAASNPDGIEGEITGIFVESPTLFDSVISADFDDMLPGTQPESAIFPITIEDVTPAEPDNQMVLITVRSADVTNYAPPMTGPDYPEGAALAAYQLVEVPILDESPEEKSITVTLPNGGEEWITGDSETISWTSIGDIGTYVRIDYKVADSPLNPITPSTNNDGTYNWNPIPDVDSEDVKVVITSVTYPAVTDESDAPFTILPEPPPLITVLTPNGGEVWTAGTSEEITWIWEGAVSDNVSIGYTKSDADFSLIAGSTENDGSFMWDPIPDDASDEVRIVVTDLDDPLVTDQSDEYFTIEAGPMPEIILTVPNGGEVWEAGTSESIEWENFGDTGAEVNISYTINDALPVIITSSEPNTGFYSWDPIPEVNSDKVKMRVESVNFPGIFDDSDDYFSIITTVQPEIIVTSPNGGEVWYVDGSEDITWDSIGDVGDTVEIKYSVGPNLPVTLEAEAPNTGTYTWDPIPNLNSDEILVYVISDDDPGVNDQSDNYFTIEPEFNPSITVVTPNGGEEWELGSAQTIEWTSQDITGQIKITYTPGDMEPPVTIEAAIDNTGSYVWDPVEALISDTTRILISSVDSPGIIDASDEWFSIVESTTPIIHVVTPNGGEEWSAGSDHTIEWTSENITGQVMIEYRITDTGNPMEIVAATDDDGSFDWIDIPNTPSHTCRVIISSIDFPIAIDESNDYFSITEPKSLTLTTPNGGETLDGDGTWTVEWTYSGVMDNVRLSMSTDSGATYPFEIVASTPCNGSYIWDPIPDIDTTTARVKIEYTEDASINDESDGDFTIDKSGVDTGWIPDPLLTQIALTSPEPNHQAQPADIALFSGGDDTSFGEISEDDGSDITFQAYLDDYSGVAALNWAYPNYASPLHKFDVLPDGSYVFVTSASDISFPNDSVNDPMHCAFAAVNNANGEFSDGFWHLYGDGGAPPDPDPDALSWKQLVDFSCGVPGGIDDTMAYHLAVHSDDPSNPVAHDGDIIVGGWQTPYDNTGLNYMFLNVSTQGGGLGYVDDTAPDSMAIAVDDNTELGLGGFAAFSMWILDSQSIVHSFIVSYDAEDVAYMADQLDDGEYGIYGTPVDVEVANAKDFDYQVTDPGFNWLCALLDNGDGTWSVGVWEMNYMGDPDPFFAFIDVTDPIDGTPMAIDVDPVDFEIHVLADNGGTVELTVFEYVP